MSDGSAPALWLHRPGGSPMIVNWAHVVRAEEVEESRTCLFLDYEYEGIIDFIEVRETLDEIYMELTGTHGEAPKGSEERAPKCPKCNGEGRVADSDDQEPWSAWETLPPGSDLAVRIGAVKPILCPACNGKGVKPK